MESKILDVISEIILKTASEKIIQNLQFTCRMQAIYNISQFSEKSVNFTKKDKFKTKKFLAELNLT
jgi:hypothetical protein